MKRYQSLTYSFTVFRRGIAKLLLLLFALAVYGCADDDEPTPDGAIRTGSVESALFYSSFVQPDTVKLTPPHTTEKRIDLDNDGLPDIRLVSMQDTLKVSGTNIPQAFQQSFEVRVEAGATASVYIALNVLGQIRALPEGRVVSLGSEDWVPLNQPLFFAYRFENFSSGELIETSNWDNQGERFMVFYMVKNSQTLIGWLKLSVSGYDDYILYNFATFDTETL